MPSNGGWTVMDPAGGRFQVALTGVAEDDGWAARAAKQRAEAGPPPDIEATRVRLAKSQQDAEASAAELPRALAAQKKAVEEFRTRRPEKSLALARMRLACAICQAPMETGDRFCQQCGASPAEMPGPPGTVASSVGEPPPRTAKCEKCGADRDRKGIYCPACGAQREAKPHPAPIPNGTGAPPKAAPARRLPPMPPVSGLAISFVRGAVRARAAGPRPEQGLTAFASKVIAAISQIGIPTQHGFGALLANGIRALLGDRTIYRRAAATPSFSPQSWMTLIASCGISSSVNLLATLIHPTAIRIVTVETAVRVAVALIGVVLVHLLAGSWTKKPVPFGQMFRPLALAQSPLCLTELPLVGDLASLWCLVTDTSAIRQGAGLDTGRALVLAAVHVILMSVGYPLLLPIVTKYLRL